MGTKSTGGREIVQVQGERIARFTGRKDRHSKVFTAKGPRDRRVRLSAQTAIQFYDIQDRLGYDRPSKAVDWLIKKAKSAIDNLAELPPCHPVEHLEAERNAVGRNEMALAAEPSESIGCSFLLHGQLADNPNNDYMKSFVPTCSTTSSMNFQSYPSEITSRTTSNNHAKDLGLSLHSFHGHQGLIHGVSQDDNTRRRPSNDRTMFVAASTPLGFESNFQRMVAWNGKTDMENSMVADGRGFAFIPPSLPLHQHALLMSQGPAFAQRGPLQSSSAQSVRAWSDLPMATSKDHHGTNEIHQSLIFGSRFASGVTGFSNIQVQIHGQEESNVASESAHEEITENVKARDRYLAEGEKQIKDMEKKIMQLHSTLANLKGESLLVAERISVLEEEVQGLWAVARKNNFDLYVLESQAQEAEDRLEMVTSQAEKMDDIVTEQWIQIQRLEQALELKIRVSLAQRQTKLLRCTFLKFMHVLSGKWDSYISPKTSALRSYMSQTLNQLTRLFLTVKEFHHELQAFVRQKMERHEFTSSLANQELVFFVASALIVFPVLSAWTWLSSKFP